MHGWLARLPERAYVSGAPAAWIRTDRPIDLIIDQRRATAASRDLLGCEGVQEHAVLLAGTPMAPLQEASPWLIRVSPDSNAWRNAESLCRQRCLGWCCQLAPNVAFVDLLEYLQDMVVWNDAQGGQSLVNWQDPRVLTALLGSAEWRFLRQWLAPLGGISTPTPQGRWQAWQEMAPDDVSEATPRLTREMQAALKAAPRAWFLAERLEIRLDELDSEWLQGLQILNQHGITRPRHLEALLPLLKQPGWWQRHDIQELLEANRPAWKKVEAMRECINKSSQAAARDVTQWMI
ncbi:DUF4123 domain-containing protein [Halomonas sp. I1]|uniref:DUF4123 domain-containing protein n=1 Tax=Halomonas sp. I1 TaxID=393536 RepID=UPI0028E05E2A|nr:DUF4123 domain-containing protein [Halomonas sp. I1]MDT8893327.1 DUF4123 domain-containing protein [Halomonas sp. I1]